MSKGIKIAGVVGDHGWKDMKATLLFELHKCQTETDFLFIMTVLANSMGTEKEILKIRKKLSIPEDKSKLKKQVKSIMKNED